MKIFVAIIFCILSVRLAAQQVPEPTTDELPAIMNTDGMTENQTRYTSQSELERIEEQNQILEQKVNWLMDRSVRNIVKSGNLEDRTPLDEEL